MTLNDRLDDFCFLRALAVAENERHLSKLLFIEGPRKRALYKQMATRLGVEIRHLFSSNDPAHICGVSRLNCGKKCFDWEPQDEEELRKKVVSRLNQQAVAVNGKK